MPMINVELSIGFATANIKDEIWVEDNATEEMIDKDVQEWASNFIEVSWKKAESD